MILKELFQQQYPTKTPEQLVQEPDVGNQLGMGSFGTVYKDTTNSANVIKIGNKLAGNKPEKDGFLAYMNKIKNLKLPVFPQINYIHIYQYPNPKKTLEDDGVEKFKYCFKMGMERLHPASSLSKEEWVHIINKLTYPHKIQDLEEMNEKNLADTLDSKLSVAVHYGFLDFANEEDKRIKIKIKDIEDQYLRIAISAISSLRTKFDVDLHSENFMFRRTPYGPQIVIIDPLSYPKRRPWGN